MALTLFPTPFHAMWSVILQTADGPDAVFFAQSLSHRIMTYTLFITFIVAVPILFNNFLVSHSLCRDTRSRFISQYIELLIHVASITSSQKDLHVAVTHAVVII